MSRHARFKFLASTSGLVIASFVTNSEEVMAQCVVDGGDSSQIICASNDSDGYDGTADSGKTITVNTGVTVSNSGTAGVAVGSAIIVGGTSYLILADGSIVKTDAFADPSGGGFGGPGGGIPLNYPVVNLSGLNSAVKNAGIIRFNASAVPDNGTVMGVMLGNTASVINLATGSIDIDLSSTTGKGAVGIGVEAGFGSAAANQALTGDSNAIANYGNITVNNPNGVGADGINVVTSGSVLNAAGANVTVTVGAASVGGTGVAAAGTDSTSITNAGNITLQGTFNNPYVMYAVRLGSGSLTNSGTIKATNSAGSLSEGYGVFHDSPFNIQITNTGTIDATQAGVGGAAGTAINLSPFTASNDTITNSGAGHIKGAVKTGLGNDTLTNSATITGNVDMGAGVDAFDNTGGTITGSVDLGAGADSLDAAKIGTVTGGVSLGADDDTLIIGSATALSANVDGGTGSDSLNINESHTLAGGKVSNFETTTVAAAKKLTLTGTHGSNLGNVTLSSGASLENQSGASVTTTVTGVAGVETLTNAGTITGSVSLGGGSDIFDNSGGTITGSVDLGAGADSLDAAKIGTVTGGISLGADDDTLIIGSATALSANVDGGAGSDSLNINESHTLAGGKVSNFEATTVAAAKKLTLTGTHGSNLGGVTLSSGATLENQSGASVTTTVTGAAGNETVTNAGTITGSISLAGGDDTVTNTGTITGTVNLGDGTNSVTSSGTIGTSGNTGDVIIGGTGADTVTNNAGAKIHGNIDLGAGNDTVTNQGDINGNVKLGTGDDTFTISGSGTISGTVDGGDGGEVNGDTLNLAGSNYSFDGAKFLNFEKGDVGCADISGTSVDMSTVAVSIADNCNLTNSADYKVKSITGGSGDNTITLTGSGKITATNGIDLGAHTTGDSIVADSASSTSINANITNTESLTVKGGGTFIYTGTATGLKTVDVDNSVLALQEGHINGTTIKLNGNAGIGVYVNSQVDNSGGVAVEATSVEGATGADITVSSKAAIKGDVKLGAGKDKLLNIGTIVGSIDMGAGNDRFNNADGTITGNVSLGGGADQFDNTAGTINGSVDFGEGNDLLQTSAIGTVTGGISLGADTDTLVINSASALSVKVDGGDGTDTISLSEKGSEANPVVVDGDKLSNFEIFSIYDTYGDVNLKLTGAHTYSGGIQIKDVERGAPLIINEGTLTADVTTSHSSKVSDYDDSPGGTFINKGTMTGSLTFSRLADMVENHGTWTGNINTGAKGDRLTLYGGSTTIGNIDMGESFDVVTFSADADTTATYSGAISNAESIAKTGDGTLKITGTSSFSAQVRVTGGALAFANATVSKMDLSANPAKGKTVAVSVDKDSTLGDASDLSQFFMSGMLYATDVGNITLTNAGKIYGRVDFGGGNDILTNTGTIKLNGDMQFNIGDDTLINTGGTIEGKIQFGQDNDTLDNTAGTIIGDVDFGSGDDTFDLAKYGTIQGIVDMGTGNDTVKATAATTYLLQGVETGINTDEENFGYDTLSLSGAGEIKQGICAKTHPYFGSNGSCYMTLEDMPEGITVNPDNGNTPTEGFEVLFIDGRENVANWLLEKDASFSGNPNDSRTTASSAGVILAGDATFRIDAGDVLTATIGTFKDDAVGQTLINKGTITGSVYLGGGSDTFDNTNGKIYYGNVYFEGGDDTVDLAKVGVVSDFDGTGGSQEYRNINLGTGNDTVIANTSSIENVYKIAASSDLADGYDALQVSGTNFIPSKLNDQGCPSDYPYYFGTSIGDLCVKDDGPIQFSPPNYIDRPEGGDGIISVDYSGFEILKLDGTSEKTEWFLDKEATFVGNPDAEGSAKNIGIFLNGDSHLTTDAIVTANILGDDGNQTVTLNRALKGDVSLGGGDDTFVAVFEGEYDSNQNYQVIGNGNFDGGSNSVDGYDTLELTSSSSKHSISVTLDGDKISNFEKLVTSGGLGELTLSGDHAYSQGVHLTGLSDYGSTSSLRFITVQGSLTGDILFSSDYDYPNHLGFTGLVSNFGTIDGNITFAGDVENNAEIKNYLTMRDGSSVTGNIDATAGDWDSLTLTETGSFKPKSAVGFEFFSIKPLNKADGGYTDAKWSIYGDYQFTRSATLMGNAVLGIHGSLTTPELIGIDTGIDETLQQDQIIFLNGSLNAHVNLGEGADQFVLTGGSKVNGLVDAGTGEGSDLLALLGTGTLDAPTKDADGNITSGVTNFEALALMGGGSFSGASDESLKAIFGDYKAPVQAVWTLKGEHTVGGIYLGGQAHLIVDGSLTFGTGLGLNSSDDNAPATESQQILELKADSRLTGPGFIYLDNGADSLILHNGAQIIEAIVYGGDDTAIDSVLMTGSGSIEAGTMRQFETLTLDGSSTTADWTLTGNAQFDQINLVGDASLNLLASLDATTKGATAKIIGDDAVQTLTLAGDSAATVDLKGGNDTLKLVGVNSGFFGKTMGKLTGQLDGGAGTDTIELIDVGAFGVATSPVAGLSVNAINFEKLMIKNAKISQVTGLVGDIAFNDGIYIGDHTAVSISKDATINSKIYGSDGDNRLIINGTINQVVDMGAGNDRVDIYDLNLVKATLDGGAGDDELGLIATMTYGGGLGANFEALAINDTSGSVIDVTLTGNQSYISGVNLYGSSELIVEGNLTANITEKYDAEATGISFNHTLTNKGTITGNVDLGMGEDTLKNAGGTINGTVNFGAGNDSLKIGDIGTVTGLIDMGADDDRLLISADSGLVNFSGGTISGGAGDKDSIILDNAVAGTFANSNVFNATGLVDFEVMTIEKGYWTLAGSQNIQTVNLKTDGTDVVINKGALTASGYIYGNNNDNGLNNQGSITVTAINLGLGADTINNTVTGTINGNILFDDKDDNPLAAAEAVPTSSENPYLKNGKDDYLYNAGKIVGVGDFSLIDHVAISFGDGDDVMTNIATGDITGNISMGSGNDHFNNFGLVKGVVLLDGGDDTVYNNGTIDGKIVASGNSTITNLGTLKKGAYGDGLIQLGQGNDQVTNSGTIEGYISFEGGNDKLNNSGTIGGDVTFSDEGESKADKGNDSIINSGTIGGNVTFGDGDDNLNNTGGTIKGTVNFGDGNDGVELFQLGTIEGALNFGAGNDKIYVKDVTKLAEVNTSNIDGGEGFDSISLVVDDNADGSKGEATFSGADYSVTGFEGFSVSKGIWTFEGTQTYVNDTNTEGNFGLFETAELINAGTLTAALLGDKYDNKFTNQKVGDNSAANFIGNIELALGSDTIINNGNIQGNITFDGVPSHLTGFAVLGFLGALKEKPELAGADSLINKGVITGNLNLGFGQDTLDNSGGTITGDIDFGGGADSFTGDNLGTVSGKIDFSEGNDSLENKAGNTFVINQPLSMTADLSALTEGTVVHDDDTIINAGTITFANSEAGVADILFGDGTDTLTNSGTINGNVDFGEGSDVLNNTGGTINGTVNFGAGDDILKTATLGTVTGDVLMGEGSDSLDNTGNTLNRTIKFEGGNDKLHYSTMGSLGADAFLDLGAGDDALTINNAMINGGFDFTKVTPGEGNDILILDGEGSATPYTYDSGKAISGWESLGVTNGKWSLSGTHNYVDVQLIGGNSQMTNLGDLTATVNGDDAANTLSNFNTGSITGDVKLGGGEDAFYNFGTVKGNVDMGDGADTYGANIFSLVGTITGLLDMGAGDDNVDARFVGNIGTEISGLGTKLQLGAGNDKITFTGDLMAATQTAKETDSYTLLSRTDGGDGEGDVDELIINNGGALIYGEAVKGFEKLSLTIDSNAPSDNANLGHYTLMDVHTYSAGIHLSGGESSLTLDHSQTTADITFDDQKNTLTINSSTYQGAISLGGGDDTLSYDGNETTASTFGKVDFGRGNDTLMLHSGTALTNLLKAEDENGNSLIALNTDGTDSLILTDLGTMTASDRAKLSGFDKLIISGDDAKNNDKISIWTLSGNYKEDITLKGQVALTTDGSLEGQLIMDDKAQHVTLDGGQWQSLNVIVPYQTNKDLGTTDSSSTANDSLVGKVTQEQTYNSLSFAGGDDSLTNKGNIVGTIDMGAGNDSLINEKTINLYTHYKSTYNYAQKYSGGWYGTGYHYYLREDKATYTYGNLNMGEGDNSLTNSGSIRGAALIFGAGKDTLTNSGTLSLDEGGITLGDGENTINNQIGGKIITYKTINGGKDKDIITNSGEITLYAQKGAQYAGIFLEKPDKYHTMDLGDGDNLITNNSDGVINAQIKMGSGNDTITNAGTINALEQTTYATTYNGQRYDVKAIDGLIDFGAGNNSLTNAAGGIINGGMKFGDGDDSVINRGSITFSGGSTGLGVGNLVAVRLGDGKNQFSNYGSLKGWLYGGAGEDRIDLFADSSYEGFISTGDGNDYVKIHGANIFKGTSLIWLGGGEDTLEISFDTLSGDSKLSSLIYTPDEKSSIAYDGNGGDDILRLINGSTYTLDFDNGSYFQGFDSLELGGRGKIIVSDIGTIKNVDVTQGGITVNEGTKVTVFFLKLFAKLQETKSSGGLDLNGLSVQRVLAADEQPTLDGNGTIVGNVIIGDQGHMAPGNSIGTFNIEGTYTQEAGGTFDLELDTRTQTNDMLNVIGTASIAGTLDVTHNLWRRDMALGDQLTFLTATDGVTGTFDRLTNADSLFFVQFAPVYTDTSVSVELVRDSFVLPDLNSHQQALGSALDILAASVDAGAATIREAAFIDDMTWTLKREVAPYMDQLLSQTAVQLATPSLMAKEAFMGRVSNSAILMQANTADIGTWTSNADVYRDYGDMEATGLGNAYKFQTTGGMTSLAYKYSEAINLGFALGGSATSYGGDLRFGKNGRDSLDGAFFAGYHNEGTQLAASVGFSLDDYDTARNIRTAHSNLYAEGDGSGTALSANLKAQQDMVFGNMWVSAMAGMNISQLSQKAFSETGADSIGLSFGKDSSTSAKASLGLRVSRTFTSGMNTMIRPVVGVYVDREFAGLNRDRTAHMLAAPDVVFNVVGATVDRNTIRGEFGFETIISNSVRLNLSYQNSFNKAYNVQQIGASLSWRW